MIPDGYEAEHDALQQEVSTATAADLRDWLAEAGHRRWTVSRYERGLALRLITLVRIEFEARRAHVAFRLGL